ncbi:MAG TPA: condensation domain-containing protein [Solirubrobacteraceae bacterium]|nr:condensation domain-containing protein [Solirubrobacteraceae bacterium]
MTVRIPLQPLDQALFHLDQGPTPWSCHFELRVPGRLDDARVRAAARAAANRQPIARARLAAHRRRDRRLYWEIPDQIDDVPVEVVDCDDDADADRARSALIGRRVDLTAGPPFALTLAHRPGGDSLIMNLSHVAGDGTSGVLLLASIAHAYRVGDSEQQSHQNHQVGDSEQQSHQNHQVGEVAALQAELAGRPRRTGKRDKRPRPTALVKVTGGRPGTIGSGFRQLRFDAAETAAITGRRASGVTLNDVLLGSLAVAIRRFNDAAGADPATVSLLMPIDLRQPGRAEQIVSNVFFSVPVAVLADEQSDLIDAQLAVAPRAASIKAKRLGGELLDIPAMIGRWPVGIVHVLARVLLFLAARVTAGADAAVVTNVGRVDAPLDFGPGAGSATELWITPPVQIPPGIGIGASTINGQLSLALRYGLAQFDAVGAQRFLDTWRDVLLGDAG